MACFLSRVAIKDYKSFAKCDVSLGPLTFLVGANGAGKSNFLDALRFVGESLGTSLDCALRERGGLQEVRRTSSGPPRPFGISIEFELGGVQGAYAFEVAPRGTYGFRVSREECRFADVHYLVEAGEVTRFSGRVRPPSQEDRLYLTNAAGLPKFRPVWDALSRMAFYNFDPVAMRALQPPDGAEILRRNGSNLASLLDRLSRNEPGRKLRIEEFLRTLVPDVEGVEVQRLGHVESLELRYRVRPGSEPWRCAAAHASDGTLRALGVLVALFQEPGGAPVRLVGLEEPEAALHPVAARALLEALRLASETTQVLVTTHSSELLDDKRLGHEGILAVVVRDGATEIGPIDETAKKSLQYRLFTAGELLRTNQLQPDNEALARARAEQMPLFGASK